MSPHEEKEPDQHEHESSCWFLTNKDLNRKLDKIMSAITDWAAKEQADLDGISAKLDLIVTGVKSLDDAIKALQNSPGTLSAVDQAALDSIEAASAALVTKAAAIDTTVPPVTPPTPPTP